MRHRLLILAVLAVLLLGAVATTFNASRDVLRDGAVEDPLGQEDARLELPVNPDFDRVEDEGRRERSEIAPEETGLVVSELEDALVFGRVLLPDRSPASGATVFARTGGWYSVIPAELSELVESGDGFLRVVTDAQGYFVFHEGLDTSEALTIAAQASGLPALRRRRIPFDDVPLDVGDLVLMDGLTLSGEVHGADGSILPGVRILLAAERGVNGMEGRFPGRGLEVGSTDEQGGFSVSGIAPGPWRLLFDHDDYAVETRSGEERSARHIELGVTELEAGRTISGRVLGMPSERAGDVWVEARVDDRTQPKLMRPRRVSPATDGSFLVRGAPLGGKLRLSVVEWSAKGGMRPVANVAPVLDPPASRPVTLRWGEAVALRARVVAPDGGPVESFRAVAQLGYFGGVHELEGDGEGETIEHHPGGVLNASGLRLYSEEQTTQLVIRALGFEDFKQPIPELKLGTAVDLGDVTLRKAPMIEVRVESMDRQPIEGASVRVERDRREVAATLTDVDGKARVNAARDTGSVLVVAHDDWAEQRLELAPMSGTESSVRVTLSRGGGLDVLVSSPNGASVRGHRIVALPVLAGGIADTSTSEVSRTTDRAGAAEFRRLRPGLWAVRRERNKREYRSSAEEIQPVVVTVTPGGFARVDLEAPAEGSLSGVVRDSLGTLSAATLRLDPNDVREEGVGDRGSWGTRFNRLSAIDGSFTFERVPFGRYFLVVEHDTRVQNARVEVVIDGSPSEPVDVLLDATTLVVGLVDRDGGVLPGLTLRVLGDGASRPAWNDSRTAWLDERGDLQQAWIQDCVNDRRSDQDGLVLLHGVLPEQPLVLTLEERWYRADRTLVSPLPRGQTTRHADIVVTATGDAKFTLEGSGDWGATRIVLRSTSTEESALEPIEWKEDSTVARATHLEAGPWSASVQGLSRENEWKELAASTIHVTAGEETEFRVDASGSIRPR